MGSSVVSSRFSAKAESYEKYALVQKQMAAGLLAMIKRAAHHRSIKHILEIGCGTGGLTHLARAHFHEASYEALDVAPGMLQKAQQKMDQHQLTCTFIQSDAEEWVWNQQEKSKDLILSGACFQWFVQPERTLSGLYRLLRPGGSLFFSTFGTATFCELHDSFTRAHANLGEESVRHGLSLLDADQWIQMLESVGYEDIQATTQKVILTYPTVRDFLYSVKAIGANTNRDQAAGLGRRKLMLEMMDNYEQQYRSEQGIPVTYEIMYVHGKRG
ncbi:malonyl-[acyl-carrier protein] O-methyltransferase [Brevibacillus reuszeri]|uniref:malonyl-ACP O-methyltransferase BioC n=1 Tax=Brevibacillus reuszeri TaxID=54915 RepID=UPI001B079140|nr:malonyl-ACP O-methyltransferase BioC [Brevibacillus reuszeri]GIO07416.1 malonyl-[acyl-carrier protein] O-methyltransferase [Brevibacillus reuszeri]